MMNLVQRRYSRVVYDNFSSDFVDYICLLCQYFTAEFSETPIPLPNLIF